MARRLAEPQEIRVRTSINGVPVSLIRNGRSERVAAVYQQWRNLSEDPLLLTQGEDNFLSILREILKRDVGEDRITSEEGDQFVSLCEHDTTTNLGIYNEARRRIPQAHFTEAIRPLLDRGDTWSLTEMCELVCGEWTVRWYLDDSLVREMEFTIE